MKNMALKAKDELLSLTSSIACIFDALGEERSEPHLQANSEYIHYSHVVQTVVWDQSFKAMWR